MKNVLAFKYMKKSSISFCLSGPCPPVRISTRQDCLSAIVEVAWEATNGSDFYTATIQTGDGISNVCMSDSNRCSVPGLICGRNFSVTVTASNQQCQINSSESTSLQSGKMLKGHRYKYMQADQNKPRIVKCGEFRAANSFIHSIDFYKRF